MIIHRRNLSNFSPLFSLEYCNYKMLKDKASTFRMVAFLELGIDTTYTIETSLAGKDKQHFSVFDLLGFGGSICRAVLDMYPSVALHASTLPLETGNSPGFLMDEQMQWRKLYEVENTQGMGVSLMLPEALQELYFYSSTEKNVEPIDCGVIIDDSIKTVEKAISRTSLYGKRSNTLRKQVASASSTSALAEKPMPGADLRKPPFQPRGFTRPRRRSAPDLASSHAPILEGQKFCNIKWEAVTGQQPPHCLPPRRHRSRLVTSTEIESLDLHIGHKLRKIPTNHLEAQKQQTIAARISRKILPTVYRRQAFISSKLHSKVHERGAELAKIV